MSYAIAMTDKKLSPRFSKFATFSFYDDQQREVAVYKNPALESTGCSGKKLIIKLLKERNCHTVIVRKIGKKTLARLLDAGFKVVLGNTRYSIETLLNDARLNKNQLTDISQGVENKANCCSHH